MLGESISEFFRHLISYAGGHQDSWDDRKGNARTGFSVPLNDVISLVVFHAVQLGQSKATEKTEPWFTLSKFGLTQTLRGEIVSTIAQYRASEVLKGRIGSVREVGGYVIVDIRPEAYDPMPGLTQLVKIATMHSNDGNMPSLTKKAFDKKINYRRGTYDKQALLDSLPKRKYY
jgi:hypothetical protein